MKKTARETIYRINEVKGLICIKRERGVEIGKYIKDNKKKKEREN